MIYRLICWFKGHRRGKFVRAEDHGKVKVYACPRCRRETTYRAKAAA